MSIVRTATIFAALVAASQVSAQPAKPGGLSVSPVRDYFAEYKDKHKLLMRAVDAEGGTFEERIARYEAGKKKLQDEFRVVRKTVYAEAKQTVSTRHSCTSATSGGVKDCEWKCAVSPSSDAYTKKEWVSVVGTNKGTKINASKACLRMTVAGKGQNEGTISAVFRYRPDAIRTNVERDLRELFDEIASHPKN